VGKLFGHERFEKGPSAWDRKAPRVPSRDLGSVILASLSKAGRIGLGALFIEVL